jgi:shikimate kinase
MNIYLIGAMGSGKSTLGKKLATKLGWAFRDTDSMIEQAEGMSVGTFFTTFGEEAFRRMETMVISDLAKETDIVVSCGGGTPCFNGNMEIMKNSGVVVYLKMSPEALVKRLEPGKDTRPLLRSLEGAELLEKITSLLKEREEMFEKAHIVINGLSVNLNGLIDEISSFAEQNN